MKRWTSISPTNEEYRWDLLSRHLRELGVENEYVSWKGPTDDIEDFSTIDEFDHIRLSTAISPKILKRLKVQSSMATLIGVIDGMVKNESGWWPLCAMYESINKVLVNLGAQLDMRGSVLVAGAGGTARLAVSAFFRAGFKHFLLTNTKAEQGDAFIRDVRAKLFGLRIEWVPMERIVLLPGECSVLLNSTPGTNDNPLIIELSYLNFLKRPGLLFDLNRVTERNLLMQEANDAGVAVVDGFEVAGRADLMWTKWAFGVDLDLATYIQDFKKAQKV